MIVTALATMHPFALAGASAFSGVVLTLGAVLLVAARRNARRVDFR